MAGSSPDPENVHFKGIIDAVSALQSRLWMEDDPKADAPFYVWLDYISIPQANKTLQSLSISSLALYASMPDYFVVVAPPATHVDKQCACDKQTYLRRGWYACVCLARVVWNIYDLSTYIGGGGGYRTTQDATMYRRRGKYMAALYNVKPTYICIWC